MLIRRKAYSSFVLILVLFTACAPPTPFVGGTSTPKLSTTEGASITETPRPVESSLSVDKGALRGIEVTVWHPWFGAEASLFESQVAKFNTENEWGIIVNGQSQVNYT